MENYLLDKDFLSLLGKNNNRVTYARITSLDINEQPIEIIEGRVTGGSINIDGQSSMRRTCSLSLVAQNLDLTNYFWALNTKFKLEIGIKNTINQFYPETIWFPQGIYLITSFSTSRSTTAFNISISGKDKICLLNGEVSGVFEQETVLDVINNNGIKEKYPIKDIIRDLLLINGHENNNNIILEGLDDKAVKLVRYIGEKPLIIGQEISNKILQENKYHILTFNDLKGIKNIRFTNFNEQNTENLYSYKLKGKNMVLYQFNTYDTVGYIPTFYYYNDELVAQPGETITSVLDKIINMFGNGYEYFYDVYGRFIFQKKETFIATTNEIIDKYKTGEITLQNLSTNSSYDYTLESFELLSNININNNIDKIKNNFIVYGENEKGYPIHLQYAIDTKPIEYISYEGIKYQAGEKPFNNLSNLSNALENYYSNVPIDWVEDEKIISASLDTYSYGSNNNTFILRIYYNDTLPLNILWKGKNNKPQDFIDFFMNKQIQSFKLETVIGDNTQVWGCKIVQARQAYYNRRPIKLYEIEFEVYGVNNQTILEVYNSIKALNNPLHENYKFYAHKDGKKEFFLEENFTINSVVDWRELIYQMALDYHKFGQNEDFSQVLFANNPSLVKNGKTGYEQYYTDIMGFWPLIYRTTVIRPTANNRFKQQVVADWNQDYLDNLTYKQYWLDFIEPNSEYLRKISVPQIGNRPSIKTNNNLKILFPNFKSKLVFCEKIADLNYNWGGYCPLKIDKNLANMLSIGTYVQNVKEEIDQIINSTIGSNRAISVTMIPQYHYDVNKKIYIDIPEENLKGNFVIDKISLPLTYNGTMSLNLSEISEIY